MDIKDRILQMQIIPLFNEVTKHGEFSIEGPAEDLPYAVVFQYYDGRESRCIVQDDEELEVLKLYYRNNVKAWASDEEYD